MKINYMRNVAYISLVALLGVILAFGTLHSTKGGETTSIKREDILPEISTFKEVECKLKEVQMEEKDIPTGAKWGVNAEYDCGEDGPIIFDTFAMVFQRKVKREDGLENYEDSVRDRVKEMLTEGAKNIFNKAPKWESIEEELITSTDGTLNYELTEATVGSAYFATASWQRSGKESLLGPTVYVINLVLSASSNQTGNQFIPQFIKKSSPPPLEELEAGKLLHETTIGEFRKLSCGEYDLGEYVINSSCTDFLPETQLNNSILEVDIRDRSVCRLEPGYGEYGVTFGEGLEFRIRELVWKDKGEFKLTKNDKTLLDWAESSHIKATGTSYNHLKVATRGSSIWLYVNDYLVATYQMTSDIGEGPIGIFSDSDREIRFNNLKVYKAK